MLFKLSICLVGCTRILDLLEVQRDDFSWAHWTGSCNQRLRKYSFSSQQQPAVAQVQSRLQPAVVQKTQPVDCNNQRLSKFSTFLSSNQRLFNQFIVATSGCAYLQPAVANTQPIHYSNQRLHKYSYFVVAISDCIKVQEILNYEVETTCNLRLHKYLANSLQQPAVA